MTTKALLSTLDALAAYALGCAVGCSSGGTASPPAVGAPPAQGGSTMTEPISLSCTTTTAGDGAVTLRLEAVNRSPAPVYVLASKRLPYVLFEGGRAVVLYGVNDPDPELDYYGIEIPPSRPLAPGEHLVASVQIVPLVPRHHYEEKSVPVVLPPELEVTCKLAYGETPIDDPHRGVKTINALVAWQHWITAPSLRVKTGAS